MLMGLITTSLKLVGIVGQKQDVLLPESSPFLSFYSAMPRISRGYPQVLFESSQRSLTAIKDKKIPLNQFWTCFEVVISKSSMLTAQISAINGYEPLDDHGERAVRSVSR